MKNFELFMGYLGNGVTVCNKVAMEHGDYKIIAHISQAGNINLRVPESYIPTDDMKKIRQAAAKEAEKFRQEFELLPEINQYEVILDYVPHEKFMEYIKDRRSLTKKLPEMRQYYYSIA